MKANEHIFRAFGQVWAGLKDLGPEGVLLNVALSLAVAGVALGLAHLTRLALQRGARSLPGPANAEKHVLANRVGRFTRRIVDAVLALGAAAVIAGIWGLDVAAWTSRGLGEQLIRSSLRITLLVVLTFAATQFARLMINQLMHGLAEDAPDPRRAAQLQTLTPLLRGAAVGAIVLIGAMMTLSEIGLRIGPLLAGAGVLGVALGFGAQTLVKDFITGVFLIVEDVVSVGDVANIAGFGGLVEQMTLRTIRLRDFDGTLHVFPYSEAQVIHNLTKSFSFYVFDLQIAYGADIDRALDVIRETGEQLRTDPAFRDKIIEPIEVFGVDALADSGVMLKARFKTLPLGQWDVGREFNRRIKLAFDREGIEIPYPHLKLILPAAEARQ